MPSVDPFSTTTISASWSRAPRPATTSRTAGSRKSASLKAGMTIEIIRTTPAKSPWGQLWLIWMAPEGHHEVPIGESVAQRLWRSRSALRLSTEPE